MKIPAITTAATLVIVMAGTLLPGMVTAQDFPVAAPGPFVAQSSAAPATPLDLQKAKALLAEMLDRLETHFENTKQKAEALQKITESSGVDIAETIQGYLDRIQTLKTEAQAAATGAELKAVAQEVHSLILDARLDVKKNITTRVEAHIDQFTDKTGQVQPLFDAARRRIDNLRESGKDVEAVDSDFRECQQLMQQGKANLEEAKNKFHQFQTMSREEQRQNIQMMKEGMQNVRNARATYAQAHQDCARVMREIRIMR